MKCKFCIGQEKHEAAFWIRVNDDGDQMPVCWCCWFEIAFDERAYPSFNRRRKLCGMSSLAYNYGFRFSFETLQGYLTGTKSED